MNPWVLWIGPGHRIATCVQVPAAWLANYRRRAIGEWRGRILGVYRPKFKGVRA
jgi:hypothetical protein